MNQPEILNEVELLRRYQAQKGYSDAQLAADMTLLGWTWLEAFVTGLLSGKKRPSEEQSEYIRHYLLNRYYGETLA